MFKIFSHIKEILLNGTEYCFEMYDCYKHI